MVGSGDPWAPKPTTTYSADTLRPTSEPHPPAQATHSSRRGGRGGNEGFEGRVRWVVARGVGRGKERGGVARGGEGGEGGKGWRGKGGKRTKGDIRGGKGCRGGVRGKELQCCYSDGK